MCVNAEIVCCGCGSDEFISDAAYLPVFFERALLIERMEAEEDGASDVAGALSASSKEAVQEFLVRQVVQLRDDELVAQVPGALPYVWCRFAVLCSVLGSRSA